MEIDYFEKDSGELPVIDFIDALDEKSAGKILKVIDLLEETGTKLLFTEFMGKMSGTKGLYELRIFFNKVKYRILFVIVKSTAHMLHGIIKKTQKIKQKDIDLAEDRAKIVRMKFGQK